MNKTGYIYSLTCSNPNLIYYGSTTQPLNERLSHHKTDFKINKSVSSKILFEWGDVKINMLEEIEYEDKKELLDREAYYITNLECVNKDIPGRTRKQWKKDNKDKVKLYNEKRKDKTKKWRNDNENILKEKKREYYINNKDRIIKNKKKNDEKRKEEIKKYRSVKIICDCGGEFVKIQHNRHKKSQKHKVYEFLKEIEDSNIKL